MSDDLEATTAITAIDAVSQPAKETCLIVIYGDPLGKKFNVNASSIVIGRSSKSGIQIGHESISRNHCRLENDGKTVTLYDLGSTNGTYVNDKLTNECVLKEGDLIKVGHTILKFITGDNIERLYHDEIYRLTTLDGLTQIHNKRHLMETLQRELSRSQRHHRSLSLIMFDIDHFKVVNDTYGHVAGDYVLQRLASLIKKRIRHDDFIARYGGEEFVVILPETNASGARKLAELLRQMVEKATFNFEGKDISTTISIGVATASANTANATEFICESDRKLYEAKRRGRNLVVGD